MFAASWVMSHAIGRHLEGIVTDVFSNSGPKLLKKPVKYETTVQASKLLAVIIKGFEKGYNQESVKILDDSTTA